VYRRILDPVYDNEKENWRILIKEFMQGLKKTYYNRDDYLLTYSMVQSLS